MCACRLVQSLNSLQAPARRRSASTWRCRKLDLGSTSFFCRRVPTHSVLSHDELPSTASSACTVPHLRETGERSPKSAGIELRKQRDAGRFRYVKK